MVNRHSLPRRLSYASIRPRVTFETTPEKEPKPPKFTTFYHSSLPRLAALLILL
jgi:hypothetical protein